MKNKNLIGNTEEGFKAEVFAVQKEETIDKKNLMVGDWVKDPIDNNIVWQWEPCDYEEIEVDVLPISLTPELLKKNGFWFGYTTQEEDLLLSTGASVGFDRRWCFDDGDGEITVSFPKDIISQGTVKIGNQEYEYMELKFDVTIYVHEFQHALRLCGLNELADNFKVE